jgi:NADH dehydrogenase
MIDEFLETPQILFRGWHSFFCRFLMEHTFTLNIPDIGKPRVVVIGGGFGGLNAVKHLEGQGFQVVLFDKHNYHTFQPLLYQVATAGLPAEAIASPLRQQFQHYKDFYFRLQRVAGIDPSRQIVLTEAGSLRYDYCIIAGGAKPNFFGNKEVEAYALPLKSVPEALNFRSNLLQSLELASITADPARRKAMMSIALVGGGPTGVETAGALAELKRHVLPKDYPMLDLQEMKIYLIEGLPRLLPSMSEKAGARALRDLQKMGVLVNTSAMVQNYDGKTLRFKDGSTIEVHTVIWTAGVTGESFPGLPADWSEKGRILVDEHCRLLHAENIFAIGDIALMKTGAYPKGHPGMAQVAIQMGKYVGKNLKSLYKGKDVAPFKYFDKGSLATIGRGNAVADLPGKHYFGGRPAWWIWLFVHINYLVSFRNKLLVFASWVYNYFTFDKGNRLIIRPYVRKNDPATAQTTRTNVPDEAQIYH